MYKFSKIVTGGLLALFVLAGCVSIGDALFGKTTQDEQLAWRKIASYVYVAIPARNYIANPNALDGNMAAICVFDEAFHEAMQTARTMIATGGNDLSVTLASLNSAIASLNWEVFQSLDVPDDPMEIASRAVVWVQVGTASAVEMRLWRKGFVRPKIAGFVAEQRAPSEAEWDQVAGKATEVHEAIQAGCAEPA